MIHDALKDLTDAVEALTVAILALHKLSDPHFSASAAFGGGCRLDPPHGKSTVYKGESP